MADVDKQQGVSQEVRSFALLGYEYNQNDDYDRAIEACDNAIRISPNMDDKAFYAELFFQRGWAYSMKHDDDRSIENFDQVIRLNPNHAKAYLFRGEAYGVNGKLDNAASDLEAALRIDPTLSQARDLLQQVRRVRGY
jgi:tetratricopeptide (TPR) repeat protein